MSVPGPSNAAPEPKPTLDAYGEATENDPAVNLNAICFLLVYGLCRDILTVV